MHWGECAHACVSVCVWVSVHVSMDVCAWFVCIGVWEYACFVPACVRFVVCACVFVRCLHTQPARLGAASAFPVPPVPGPAAVLCRCPGRVCVCVCVCTRVCMCLCACVFMCVSWGCAHLGAVLKSCVRGCPRVSL